MNTKEMTLIGHFSVDSGQAMIGDPCYLDNWDTNKFDEFDTYPAHANEYSYLGACNATIDNGYGELGMASSVVFSTGYGDGLYPVYAEINNEGRIARVVIEFIGDE